MNIGLTFLQQIQQGPVKLLGGWVYSSFMQMIVAVTKGYHTEHNEDDTHKTIHATGAISERSRSVAQGVWIDVPYGDVTFTGSTSTGWTVSRGSFISLAYMLIGTTMTLAWSFSASSVSGTPSVLYFTFSDSITPTRTINAVHHYNNNGTRAVGRCTMAPIPAGMQGLRVALYLVNLGNWATSTQNTDSTGQFSFEVSGV